MWKTAQNNNLIDWTMVNLSGLSWLKANCWQGYSTVYELKISPSHPSRWLVKSNSFQFEPRFFFPSPAPSLDMDFALTAFVGSSYWQEGLVLTLDHSGFSCSPQVLRMFFAFKDSRLEFTIPTLFSTILNLNNFLSVNFCISYHHILSFQVLEDNHFK